MFDMGAVPRMNTPMKIIIFCIASLSLVSCNTSIGVYRDMKQGFIWTKNKIQGDASGGNTADPYGAPTY
jgi:predicted small secreted protein